MSRFPFPRYPNGWFQVAYADEVEAGALHSLTAFGEELLVFRDADGRPRVLGAYCPHLGAHIGHGGALEEGTVRCPFHGWRFGGDGRCVEVPYADRIPSRARLPCWPVVERAGRILVWHHAGGEPPQWELPEVPELEDPAWTDGERRSWRIRTHNQEMAENSVDRAHFRYVHGTLTVPDSELEVEGPVLAVHSKTRFGTPKGEMTGAITSRAYGFGFSVTRFTGIVETLLLSSVTPVDDEDVDVRFEFFVKKLGDASATRGVGAALIRDIEKQMSEDIPIWENKVYQPRPVLCDGDGPIAAFRRWCQQFYGPRGDGARVAA